MEGVWWVSAASRLLFVWLVVFRAPEAAASQQVLSYGNTICEGDRLGMVCPKGFLIQLKTAHYGRTDLTICQDATANSTDCGGPDIADTLRPQCDGKRECYVMVGPQLQTTDACPDISKYLHVAFDCASPVYQTVVCQDEELSLTCPSGDVLRVIEATFGRTTDTVCPQGGSQASTNCSESTALEKTARMCNNEQKCVVKVTPFAFGEPCPGVHKYLNVSFKCGECANNNAQCDYWESKGECVGKNAVWMEANCRKACWKCVPTIYKITCEGSNAKISCPSSDGHNMSLRITDVFYGRNDNSICPHTAIHLNNCGDAVEPFKRAHNLCTGRPKCKVDVYSQTMGVDPCPGTYKYMQLNYRCQACENTLGNDSHCEWLASQGECLHNSQYMYRECFQACSQCDIPACGNIDNNCEYYAMMGECEKNEDWMFINCRESCRQCPAESDTVSPTTAVPPGGVSHGLKTAAACEGKKLDITCAKGEAITIKSAFYGRQGNETCPKSTVMPNTDCSDVNALSKLRQLCNAYSSCWLFVLISKLGDPCPGVSKYANVTYKCIARSELQCEIDCGSHGECIGDNMCACHKGYAGQTCRKFSCSEVNDCSSQGTCVGPNQCHCDEGWLGNTCTVPSCSGVNHCSQHGRCIRVNKCFCYPFFSGATCSECVTSFQSGSDSCLPCPNCQHGTCVQKTGTEHNSYIGCFVDKENEQDFEHLAWDSEPSLSTVKCVTKCYELGYKFAGLQAGNHCYCGNDYGRYGETDTCHIMCSGRVDGDVCGGNMATSVWRVMTGYCECDGPNWTGTRCDRCSAGYSGPLCILQTTTTAYTTTTLTTSKPQTFEVNTTTTPPKTTTKTTPVISVATVTSQQTAAPVDSSIATTQSTLASTKPTVATTTSTIATTSPIATTTKEPENVMQASTIKPTMKPSTTRPSTTKPSMTRSSSTSPAAAHVTSTRSTAIDQPRVTSSQLDNPTTQAEIPKIGSDTMMRRVSLTMTLEMTWKDIYKNRQDPETKELEANLTRTLVEVYNSRLEPKRHVFKVVIKDIRRGSVVVEHDVVLSEPFAGSEEKDIRCRINDALQEADTVAGATASLSQRTENMCTKRASFCTNDATLGTYENGTWYCVCTPGYLGERCESSKEDITVIVIVIVVACTVPLLLILSLCYIIEMRAAKQRNEKAAFVGTAVSYRYQDLSRAKKNSPRRLFQGQGMTENADVDGFEPRQI